MLLYLTHILHVYTSKWKCLHWLCGYLKLPDTVPPYNIQFVDTIPLCHRNKRRKHMRCLKI